MRSLGGKENFYCRIVNVRRQSDFSVRRMLWLDVRDLSDILYVFTRYVYIDVRAWNELVFLFWKLLENMLIFGINTMVVTAFSRAIKKKVKNFQFIVPLLLLSGETNFQLVNVSGFWKSRKSVDEGKNLRCRHHGVISSFDAWRSWRSRYNRLVSIRGLPLVRAPNGESN